jgi:hypothetical protein
VSGRYYYNLIQIAVLSEEPMENHSVAEVVAGVQDGSARATLGASPAAGARNRVVPQGAQGRETFQIISAAKPLGQAHRHLF